MKTKGDARTVAKRLEDEKRVLVHAYGNDLLRDYLRVSVGSKAAMEKFLQAFFEVEQA